MQISKVAHGQVIIGHSWVLLLLFLGPLQDENVRHLFERVSELRQQYEDQMMECWEAPEDDQDMYEDIPSDRHVSEVTGDPLEAPAPNPETPKAMMLRHRSKASTASLASEPPAPVAATPESAAAVPTDMLETMTEAQKMELASLVMQMESINLQSRTHLLLRNMHAIFTQAAASVLCASVSRFIPSLSVPHVGGAPWIRELCTSMWTTTEQQVGYLACM